MPLYDVISHILFQKFDIYEKVFERISNYSGDLQKDTKGFDKKGKRKLKDQLGKLYNEVSTIIH